MVEFAHEYAYKGQSSCDVYDHRDLLLVTYMRCWLVVENKTEIFVINSFKDTPVISKFQSKIGVLTKSPKNLTKI